MPYWAVDWSIGFYPLGVMSGRCEFMNKFLPYFIHVFIENLWVLGTAVWREIEKKPCLKNPRFQGDKDM